MTRLELVAVNTLVSCCVSLSPPIKNKANSYLEEIAECLRINDTQHKTKELEKKTQQVLVGRLKCKM